MKENEHIQQKLGIEKLKANLIGNGEGSGLGMWLTDLDGTIKESKKFLWEDGVERKILPETVAALRVLHAVGIKIGIVTGQAFDELTPWITEVAGLVLNTQNANPFEVFNGYIVGEEGGVVKTSMGNKERVVVPKGSLGDRNNILSWLQSSITQTDEDGWGVLDGIDPHEGTRVRLWNNGESNKAMVDLWERGPDVTKDPSYLRRYKRVKDHIDAKIDELGIASLKTYEAGGGSVCIVPRIMSKGHTVELLTGIGALDPNHIVFSCDGFNDVSLAEYLAKHGGAVLAVGNAIEKIQHVSDYTAKSEAGLGFAEAIAAIFPQEYEIALQEVTAESLLRKSPDENSVSYEAMMDKVATQMEHMLANPHIFKELQESLQHGSTSPEVIQIQKDQEDAFGIWIENCIQERMIEKKQSTIGDGVENLSPETLLRIKKKAEMHYLVERDLVGPLIFHFANAIATWQKNGMLPGLTVGMFRDFQPFFVAANELGAHIEPWYLRRALFRMGDELDKKDIVKEGGDYIAKLAMWLKPLLTAEHVNLLDSGCWGTIVYEIAGLRSVLNWLANSQECIKQLEETSSKDRLKKCKEMLPVELFEVINTGVTLAETETRWGILQEIVNNSDYLDAVKKLKGQTLTTTALDHYSHAWQDPRFPNHQQIYSHIDIVAKGAMPSPIFGEIVNDTIEENHASKIYKGPTQLEIQEDGSVDVILEKNDEFEEEIAAWASCKGVQDAVQICLMKMKLGILVDPTETIAHMNYLANKAKTSNTFTGVLPQNTPTWSEGNYFLSHVWPLLTNNPYSTYVPFKGDE